MLTEERRRLILEVLRHDGKVLVTDLSRRMDVSEDTIRRDLRELAEGGLVQRVHGGALPRSPSDARYVKRAREAPEAKVMIADEAARLIRPGQVVILDSGTTALEVARRLPLELEATIITNSPPAAIALADYAGLDLILVGGTLYKESLAVIGSPAIEALRGIRADLCVLGVAGLHPEIGISVLNHEEPHVKRAMIEGAAEVVAVAAADKLGTAAPYVVGPVNLLTHIVTDRSATEEQVQPYRDLGVTIIVAGS